MLTPVPQLSLSWGPTASQGQEAEGIPPPLRVWSDPLQRDAHTPGSSDSSCMSPLPLAEVHPGEPQPQTHCPSLAHVQGVQPHLASPIFTFSSLPLLRTLPPDTLPLTGWNETQTDSPQRKAAGESRDSHRKRGRERW